MKFATISKTSMGEISVAARSVAVSSVTHASCFRKILAKNHLDAMVVVSDWKIRTMMNPSVACVIRKGGFLSKVDRHQC